MVESMWLAYVNRGASVWSDFAIGTVGAENNLVLL